MAYHSLLILFLLSISYSVLGDSCADCLQSKETVILDPSLPTSSDAINEVLESVNHLCKSSFITEWEIHDCVETSVNYLIDLYEDLNSESEHSEEKVILSTKRLCSIVSACETACCLTDWEPEQIHLSKTELYSEMVVSWVTLNPWDLPVVEYWQAVDFQLKSTMSFNLTINVVEADISTYTAGGWVGTIYNATLTNLLPGTPYYYKITGSSNNTTPAVTEEHYFITDIVPSNSSLQSRSIQAQITPFIPNVTASVVAYFGDVGTGDNSQESTEGLIQLATNSSVQLIIQGGDLSYADGTESIWDEYMRMVSDYSDIVPVMTAPGNHENYYLFDAYRHRYFMPWSESGSQQYYSYNHEKIHFVTWSFEEFKGVDLLPGGKQRQWLEADLQQANLERDVRPWIVLYGHRPFYCSSDSHDCEYMAEYMRFLLEDIINEYHVDVVLQAHKHNYERTYPVYKNEKLQDGYTDPLGPMYYVVGTGGRDKNSDFIDDPEDWSADRDDKYGYLLLSAPNESVLEMSYISKSFNIHDSATITRTEEISNWSFLD